MARRVPPRLGCDANGGLDPSRCLLGGISFVGRYVSDDRDAAMRNITPDEARSWRDVGMPVVIFWQNDSSTELWGSRSGASIADAARRLMQPIGGGGQPFTVAVDKPTSLDGRWPIDPVLRKFEQAAKRVGVPRLGGYGSRFTLEALFSRGLISYGCQTVLHDPRAGDRSQHSSIRAAPLHPDAQLWQWRNTDLQPQLDHYGAEGVSYVCLDHAFAHDFGQFIPQL